MIKTLVNNIRTTKTKKDGKVEVRFVYKDKACPAIEINSNLGKICADFQLIIKDLEIIESTLETAITFIKKLAPSAEQGKNFDRQNADHIIFNSLLISAIVTYWKCFAASTHRSGKITEQKLRKTLGETLYDTHELIKEKRHSFVAHGGKNQHESAKTIILLDPYAEAPAELIFHTSFEHFGISEHIDSFLLLVSKVLDLTRKTQAEKCSALLKELGETNFDELRKT